MSNTPLGLRGIFSGIALLFSNVCRLHQPYQTPCDLDLSRPIRRALTGLPWIARFGNPSPRLLTGSIPEWLDRKQPCPHRRFVESTLCDRNVPYSRKALGFVPALGSTAKRASYVWRQCLTLDGPPAAEVALHSCPPPPPAASHPQKHRFPVQPRLVGVRTASTLYQS